MRRTTLTSHGANGDVVAHASRFKSYVGSSSANANGVCAAFVTPSTAPGTRPSTSQKLVRSRASSASLHPVASVPPLNPPSTFVRNDVTLTARAPGCLLANSVAATNAPTSAGTLSNPAHGTMRAPVARAVASWASMTDRIQPGSPVRSA